MSDNAPHDPDDSLDTDETDSRPLVHVRFAEDYRLGIKIICPLCPEPVPLKRLRGGVLAHALGECPHYHWQMDPPRKGRPQ